MSRFLFGKDKQPAPKADCLRRSEKTGRRERKAGSRPAVFTVDREPALYDSSVFS
jgi:hypothetical protein